MKSQRNEIANINETNDQDIKEYFTKEDQLFTKIDEFSKNLGGKLETVISRALGKDGHHHPSHRGCRWFCPKLADQQSKFVNGVKDHGQKLDAFAQMAEKDVANLTKNMSGVVGNLKSSIEDNASNIRDSIKEISDISKSLKSEIDELTKVINSKRK